MAVPIKIFTPEELKAYFKGELKGHYYKDAVSKYEEFLPHSDGEKPMRIIDKQRPNEPDTVKAFRLEIWEPITKPTFARLLSSLSKIRRSSDWGLVYPKDDFSLIREGDELEEYCESNYPYFTSVTNWVFGVLLKPYLIDSNAVVLVMPLKEVEDVTEYVQPFTYVYHSCNVVYYKEQESAILKISEGCTYYNQLGKIQAGESYYVINAVTIERYDQIDEKGNFSVTYAYSHNLNYLPVFKLGGNICKSSENNFLYESRISGILPNLNEAIAEYTDLQAGKRLNIYPERWEFTQHECPKCKGTGLLPNNNWKPGDAMESRQLTCRNCNHGYMPSGPYSKMILRPADIGQQSIPTPPAGFIEKDIRIIELMDASVDKHIYKALAAINFQFLEQVPLNQSGIAKEVDKEELNNTVHSIAEDLVALMDKIYKTIAYYRYGKLYPQKEIDAMLPTIPVPEHFDLISSQYMQEEIDRARKAQINPLLISAMQVEYSSKRFAQNPELNKIIKLVYILDPLPGRTTEDKVMMSANKSITRENNIISDNIDAYVRRALFENQDFDNWELDKQMELMRTYAGEQIAAMDEAAKLIAAALQNGVDQNGDPLPPEDEDATMEEENETANVEE